MNSASRGPLSTMIQNGMFTAVLAVLSIIQIPMPSGVPFTLQTFAVALCGTVLGRRNGTYCVLLYLLLGFMGIPVFHGMTGGLHCLFQYTGGFLYGFLPLAFFCGISSEHAHKKTGGLFCLTGLLFCHLLGIFHYQALTQTGFLSSALLVSIPYLPKDIVSVIGARSVSRLLRKQLALL